MTAASFETNHGEGLSLLVWCERARGASLRMRFRAKVLRRAGQQDRCAERLGHHESTDQTPREMAAVKYSAGTLQRERLAGNRSCSSRCNEIHVSPLKSAPDVAGKQNWRDPLSPVWERLVGFG